MIKTLTIEIDFDENVTDADSVGAAVDSLLETAMSTPGILEEYGNPSIGQTCILKEAKLSDSQIRELISSIDRYHGNELKDRSEKSISDEVKTIRSCLGG